MVENTRDKVVADEPIVELETDKVNVEVPAPSNGILGTIEVKEGETVNVGSLLGTINNSAKKEILKETKVKSYTPPKKQPKLFEEKKKEVQNKKIIKPKMQEQVLTLENEKVDDEPLVLMEAHEEKKVSRKPLENNKETKVSPAARKIASEAKIDLDKERLWKNGIILKEDIMELMAPSLDLPKERSNMD